jgi:hypothetical protein
LDEITKIYIKSKRYFKAVSTLLLRLKYTNSETIRQACVNHDIGSCYFLLGDNQKAHLFAKQSYDDAERLKCDRWGLNSRILIAQIYTKENIMHRANEFYSSAILIAKKLGDKNAVDMIGAVMSSLIIQKEGPRLDLMISDDNTKAVFAAT